MLLTVPLLQTVDFSSSPQSVVNFVTFANYRFVYYNQVHLIVIADVFVLV